MSYRQLTLDERYQIQALRGLGVTQAEIARRLDRSPSTISRELKRNSVEHDYWHRVTYNARRAASFTRRRRVAKGLASRKLVGELAELVEQKLRMGWSPEQISGRLWLERRIQISHETVYKHVLRDEAKPPSQRKLLRYALRFAGYSHSRFKRSRMAERTRERKGWLEDRPAAANERSEIGHWERDILLGKRGKSALLTMIDRRSRYVLVRHVKRVNARRVATATKRALKRFRKVSKTITNDNGVEFQKQKLQNAIGLPIYFTDPGKPWQRGSIENANGLIRQYFRKRFNMDNLTKWAPAALEETLNFRPRKILGWRTPHEVFFGKNVKLTRGELLRFGIEISYVN